MDPSSLQQSETLLALLAQPGIGPASALKIAHGCNVRQRVCPGALEQDVGVAREHMAEWGRLDILVTGYFDQAYPVAFRKLNDPPPVLFSQGNSSLLFEENLIAVVGTREPSAFGKKVTIELVEALPSDWGVVSGLARGIDTIAHRAALEYGHPTIAILGNGIDNPYPHENQTLAREIIRSGGLLVSEQPPGTPPLGHHLVQRDRLQSRLSRCVFVAQTGLTGGTLYTARYAAMQSVPIFCPPNPDNDPRSEGLHTLLTAPANTLPKLLPAWNKPERWMNDLDVRAPLAAALAPSAAYAIESALNNVTLPKNTPPTLF